MLGFIGTAYGIIRFPISFFHLKSLIHILQTLGFDAHGKWENWERTYSPK